MCCGRQPLKVQDQFSSLGDNKVDSASDSDFEFYSSVPGHLS